MQVGCTINYGRRGLWKQTEELACVDYPGNVGENDCSTSLDPDSTGFGLFVFNRGPVAQLGARFHGMEEVVGSIPTRSTKFFNNLFSPQLRPGDCLEPRHLCRGHPVRRNARLIQ